MTLFSYLIVMATTALVLSCRWRWLKRVPLLGRALTNLARGTRRLAERVSALRAAPPEPPDPFESLHVQMRLEILSHEIRRLHEDDTIYARAARLKASTAAYDALLRNACDLAGVIDLDQAGERDARTMRELQLAERGWSW